MSVVNMLNPRYWYYDEDGKITKYQYCKLCHAGPFKESENMEKFIFFGMSKNNPYCRSCAQVHNNFQTDTLRGLKPQMKEPPVLNPFLEETIVKMSEL